MLHPLFNFPLAPFYVFSEVDVETSVQIMQSQDSEEGRMTDMASDRMHDHITWLTERVPVNEEAYPSLHSQVYGFGFFSTGCQFLIQTRAFQGHFQICTLTNLN